MEHNRESHSQYMSEICWTCDQLTQQRKTKKNNIRNLMIVKTYVEMFFLCLGLMLQRTAATLIHNLCATNARQKLQLRIDEKAFHAFSQPEMWHHQVQASGVTLMNRNQNQSVTALFVPIGYLF